MKTRSLAAIAIVSLLAACQSAAPIHSLSSVTIQSTAAQSTAVSAPIVPVYQSPVLPKVDIKPEAQVKVQGSRVTLEVKLPALSAYQNTNQNGEFKTQLLDLATAAKITAKVRDSYGKIYTPVGADGNGQINYPAGGNITLNFTGVIPDELLFIELQVTDGSNNIPQADLATVVKNVGIGDVIASMNFQTTPMAKTMKDLLSQDAARARAINLADLTTLMTSITGVTGTAPNFSYVCHPTLVDTAALATALRTQPPTALTASTYRREGATVGLTVTGLVGSDTIEVQSTDAASARKLAVAAGSSSLTGATPGTGINIKVGATASNSTQYTFAVTPNTNLTLTNGATTNVSITATPAAVSLSSLTPNNGTIGSSIVIAGTGFSTTAANNLVKFGSTTATVTAASATSLTVNVPTNLSGAQNVTVQVGSQTSNALAYQVRPTISSLSASSGIVGSTITLTGSGFDATTPGNNTVRFGTTSATVTGATANSLSVTVPATSGTKSVTVQVGTQTSTGVDFAITPELNTLSSASGIVGSSLTLTGTGFSAVTNGNTVSFGGANVTGTANAAGTSLTVNVPAGFGSRNVSVTVDTQSSGVLAHAVTPNITSLSAVTGSSGDTLDLNVTGYDPTLTNNTLKLGNTTLTPSSPSAGVLRVTVPNDPAGPANATLQTGTQTSAVSNFTLKPKLISLSTAAGAVSGKAALVRNQVLTIAGSNFDLTPGNNNVSFTMGATTVSALASTATASQLTVIIPGTVDVIGDVSVSVSSNTQASNTLTGVVPTVNLSVPNGGFY